MDFQFGAAAAGGVAPHSGAHLAAPPFHGNQQPPRRPLYVPIPDPRSAGLTADAARELKKARIREEILAREAEEDRLLDQEVWRELQFERAMAERLREVQQLGLFPPMPGAPANRFPEPRVGDSVQRLRVPPPPNAGPYLVPYTPHAWGRERQGPVQSPSGNLERPESVEVPHCSGETHPLHIDYKLEASVGKRTGSVSVQAANNLGTCSLPIAHGVGGERLGSVHHSDNQGPLLPISHRLESTAGDSVQRLGVPPPPNAGPYLVPYTPQAWGRDRQGPVQSPPGNLERPESVEVPHCSGEAHPLHIDYKLEASVGKRPGSIHQSVDQRPILPEANHPEDRMGVNMPVSLHPDSELVVSLPPPDTRLETGLFGHPPEGGFSGWPPSNLDIRASKSGKKCSGKGKKKAKVKKSAKKAPRNCYRCGQSGHGFTNCGASEKKAERYINYLVVNTNYAHAPPASNDVCYGCGNSGHKKTSCPFLKKEAKTQKVKNKKRKLKALAEGYTGFNGTCFQCEGIGHRQKDCLPMRKQDATSRGLDGICFQCGGSGHCQKDCLLLREEDAPLHPLKKGRCLYCGGREHVVNDCLLFTEKVERNKNSLQKQNAKKNTDLEDNKKKNKHKALAEGDAPPHSEFRGKCFRCGRTGHLRKDCPVSDEEVHKNNQQKKRKMKTGLDEDKGDLERHNCKEMFQEGNKDHKEGDVSPN